MKMLLALFSVVCLAGTGLAHEPAGEQYYVVQFPDGGTPTIDGNNDDWAHIPDEYTIGMDKLFDPGQMQEAERGGGDLSDMNINHVVGWNDNNNKLYFVTTVFDNVHNTDREGGCFCVDDALEIELLADELVGGGGGGVRPWRAAPQHF